MPCLLDPYLLRGAGPGKGFSTPWMPFSLSVLKRLPGPVPESSERQEEGTFTPVCSLETGLILDNSVSTVM